VQWQRPDVERSVVRTGNGGQRHGAIVRVVRGSRRVGDFGGNGEYGIPYLVVESTEPKRTINYTAYGDESSPRPFPIPPTAPIESGSSSDGDRHVIVVQKGTCHLYELYRAFWRGNRWDADAGVNWNLGANPRRPGLARYGETSRGEIDHALRFTVPRSYTGPIRKSRGIGTPFRGGTLVEMVTTLGARAHDAVSAAQRSELAGVLSVSEPGIPASSEGDKA
jgi:hypothetical protein